MKFFKKALIVALAATGAVCLALGAAACKKKTEKGDSNYDYNDGLPSSYTDDNGIKRPNNAWLTESVIIAESEYYDNWNNLFGDGGETGLVNKKLLNKDTDRLLDVNGNSVEGYLIYYLYGNGLKSDFEEFDADFKISYVEGFNVTYNPDFITIAHSQTEGMSLDVAFYNSSGYSTPLKVSLSPDEEYPELSGGRTSIMSAICFNFRVANFEEHPGDLYFNVNVSVPSLAESAQTHFSEVVRFGLSPKVKGEASAEIKKVTAKYVAVDDLPDGDLDGIELKDEPDMADGKINYMVIDFAVTALTNNNGGNTLNTLIRVPESEFLEARLMYAPTGNLEMVESNNETFVAAYFSIPEKKGASKNVRIIIRLTPKANSIVNVELYLTSDGCKLTGSTYNSFKVQAGTEILKLELNDDGKSYCVVGIWDEYITDIVIPETFEGLPVTTITAYFGDLQRLKSLVIGDSVTDILNSDFIKNSESIRKITFGKGITNLPYGKTFEGCVSLQEITINGKISELSNNICADLPKLKKVKLPEVLTLGDGCFSNCPALTTVEFGNNLTKIGGRTFMNCVSLAEITLPDSVKEIGFESFRECTGLKSVVISKGVTEFNSGLFFNCELLTSVTGEAKITRIYDNCFKNCKSLTSAPFISEAGTIGSSAFEGCTGITSVALSSALTTIDWKTFSGCTRLSSLSGGKDVAYVYSEAFKNCSSLKTMPFGSVKSIGDSAFENCSSLTEINIPDSCTSVGSKAFAGTNNVQRLKIGSAFNPSFREVIGMFDCGKIESIEVSAQNQNYRSEGNCLIYDKVVYLGCKNSVIPTSGIIRIESGAFAGATGLTSITVPSNIKETGTDIFKGCTGLKTVKLGSRSNSDMFKNCTSLTTVEILSDCEWIGLRAFFGCTALTSVTINVGITLIESSAFSNCSNLKQVTFKGTTTEWNSISKQSGWNTGSGITSVKCSNGTVSVK